MDDFDTEAVVNAMRALSEVFANLGNALTTITENLHVISEAYLSQFEDTEEDFEDEDSGIPEPTNDYIKRSDINDAMREWWENDDDHRSIAEVVENIPAADVKPKREIAPWKVAGAFDDFHQCTKCGNMWPIFSTVEWAYCPVCGFRKLPEPPKEEENGN